MTRALSGWGPAGRGRRLMLSKNGESGRTRAGRVLPAPRHRPTRTGPCPIPGQRRGGGVRRTSTSPWMTTTTTCSSAPGPSIAPPGSKPGIHRGILRRDSGLPPQAEVAWGLWRGQASPLLPPAASQRASGLYRQHEEHGAAQRLAGYFSVSVTIRTSDRVHGGKCSVATVATGDGPLFRSGRAPGDVIGDAGPWTSSSPPCSSMTPPRKMGSLQLQFFFLSEHSVLERAQLPSPIGEGTA